MAAYPRNINWDWTSAAHHQAMCSPQGASPCLATANSQGAVSKEFYKMLRLFQILRQQLRNKQLVNHQVVTTLPASTLVLRHIQLLA